MSTLQIDPITHATVETDEIVNDDLEIEEFKLELARASGNNWALTLKNVVTDAVVERTMEGASNITVTVHDPLGDILRSGSFDRAIDVYVDKLWWRLVAVNKNDSELDLVFEDRDVAYVREHKEVVKGNRKNMTRAEFCVRLLKRVKAARFKTTTNFISPGQVPRDISIVCPELHKTQPKEKGKKQKQEIKARKREAGIFNDGTLRVWYHGTGGRIPRDSGVANNPVVTAVPFTTKKATNAQIDIGEQILDEAARMHASNKVMVTAIAVGMEESGLANLSGGDRDSVGVFQQRPSQGWTGLRDVTKAAHQFLERAISYDKSHPHATHGEIASYVQMGGHQISSYKPVVESAAVWAKKWVEHYGGADLSLIAYRRKFVFSTAHDGKKEDWWTAIGRILSDVGWARFMSNGVVYIIAEKDLLKSKVRMRLSEQTPGVDRINFNYDVGKTIANASITCRATRWVAPPGSVVELVGCGPASGRWLVSDITRSLGHRDATITLKKPVKKLSEPQADLVLRESIDEWISRNHTDFGGPTGNVDIQNAPRDSGVSPAGNTPPGKTGRVYIRPGANLPGVPIRADMMTFLGLVAGMTSEQITVMTGTNHGLTVNGSRSNHQPPWCGAADISVDSSGPPTSAHGLAKGNNILIAGYRVCGLSYREAKQLLYNGGGSGPGGVGANFSHNLTWRGHSIEFGWQTMVGGNHFNHVHMGMEWGT